MALTKQTAWWGIRASGTLGRVGVSGASRVGFAAAQTIELASSDVAYSFKATATGAGQTATLQLSDGQVTGTASFEDEGVDFEGETLPTMVDIKALAIKAADGNTGAITIASDGNFPDAILNPGQVLQVIYGDAGESFASDTIGATIAFNTDSFTLYAIAGT